MNPPFKGLNVGIPIIIPIKGRGFMNHGFQAYYGVSRAIGGSWDLGLHV